MDFNKIIDNVKELQEKVDFFNKKEQSINDTISLIKKDIIKLKKKMAKEEDLINKKVIELRIMIMEDIINRFNIMV